MPKGDRATVTRRSERPSHVYNYEKAAVPEKNMADHVLQIRTGGKVHNYVSRALELLPVCANIRSCAHH